MIITTTNNIQGVEIQQYLGVITSNEVVGIDIVSKWLGSITDAAGGRSGAFRKRVDELTDMVCRSLYRKAREIGANAVIGYSVNVSEISGKDSLMIMATATGTAVKIDSESAKDRIDSSNTYGGNKYETNISEDPAMEAYRKKWAKK